MNQRRTGFTLVEAILAAFLVAVAFTLFLGVFSSSVREATQSREQILADAIVLNTLEEIWNQQYGSTRAWWGAGNVTRDVVVPTAVEGQALTTKFTCAVTSAPEKGGNGSFFGAVAKDYDVLKVTLSWTAGTGASAESKDSSRVLYTTVWRQNCLPGN